MLESNFFGQLTGEQKQRALAGFCTRSISFTCFSDISSGEIPFYNTASPENLIMPSMIGLVLCY